MRRWWIVLTTHVRAGGRRRLADIIGSAVVTVCQIYGLKWLTFYALAMQICSCAHSSDRACVEGGSYYCAASNVGWTPKARQ